MYVKDRLYLYAYRQAHNLKITLFHQRHFDVMYLLEISHEQAYMCIDLNEEYVSSTYAACPKYREIVSAIGGFELCVRKIR